MRKKAENDGHKMIARNLGVEKAKFESEPHDSKAGSSILIVPAQITQKCQITK